MPVSFSTETSVCIVTPRHENENEEVYQIRLIELHEYRKALEDSSSTIPFDRDEFIDTDCLFDRVFRSSFFTTYYNKYVREAAKLISRAQNDEHNALFSAFQDGLRSLSSSIDKETLYSEVKAMAEMIEEKLRLIPAHQKAPVYEAQDPISLISLDRLQELRTLFLTVHFPILGI